MTDLRRLTCLWETWLRSQDDIDLLNTVANSPEVLLASAPGYALIELAAFFDNPRNLMVGNAKGVVLFGFQRPGVYDMHYLFTDKMRGPDALRAAKDAIRQLFTYRDVHAIVGATPRDNRAARAMNRALGGRPAGESVDSLGRSCVTYILERETWVRLSGA